MLKQITNCQKVIKTFVFENQSTHQSIIFNQEVDQAQAFVNLNYLLLQYCSLHLCRVTIYDPYANRFVSLHKIGSQNGLISQRYFEPTFIFIRYIKKTDFSQQEEDNSSNYQLDSDRKDVRSKERTIGQVIQLVKQWRQLHLTYPKFEKPNKKINLKEAALMMGVSKKSLDDYYCQLRLAESLQFDFENKLDQKIGILRSFVKANRSSENDQIKRHRRNLKSLKIISELENYPKVIKNQCEILQKQASESRLIVSQSVNYPITELKPQKEEKQQNHSQDACEQNVGAKELELFELQNEFYKGFEFFLDEPAADPFLSMNLQSSVAGSDHLLFS